MIMITVPHIPFSPQDLVNYLLSRDWTYTPSLSHPVVVYTLPKPHERLGHIFLPSDIEKMSLPEVYLAVRRLAQMYEQPEADMIKEILLRTQGLHLDLSELDDSHILVDIGFGWGLRLNLLELLEGRSAYRRNLTELGQVLNDSNRFGAAEAGRRHNISERTIYRYKADPRLVQLR